MHRTRSKLAEQLGDGLHRRARAQREARAAAGVAHRRERVVGVRRRLDVDRDAVGAGLRRTSRRGAPGARPSGGRRRSRPRRAPDPASASTTGGPMLSAGTKWPSMTSTWIVARARGEHGADLLAQAREVGREDRGRDARGRGRPSDRLEHRAPAVVAGVERGARHPHDRRVLAAVRAHRGELEAAQAVHAAVAPGQVRGAQPRLVAGRADVAEVTASSSLTARPRGAGGR